MINRLSKIFISRENVLGQTEINQTSQKIEGQKVNASVTTNTEAITSLHWEEHLKGNIGVGLSPILQNNKCRWCAIDLDVYPTDIVSFSKKYHNLPLFFCRTKSGGCHVYLFFKKEIKAKDVRLYLDELALLLQFNKVEIFPKQERLDPAASANWINLPYFGGDNTDRYCVYNGIQLTLKQFIETVEQNLIEDFNEDVLRYFELSGAPYCLQKMFNEGIVKGYRDIFLFNLAIFYKQKYRNDWKDKVRFANKTFFNDPIDESQVEKTVINQIEKKEMFYQCKSHLVDFCNKKICKLKKFGLTTKNSPDGIFGKLYKTKTEPPFWRLEVDETTIELTTAELMSQSDVRIKCMEKLNKIIPQVKPNDWHAIIQERLDMVEEIDAPEDATEKSLFYELVKQFCLSRSSATRDLADVLTEKVFIQEGVNLFRGIALHKYLTRNKFTRYSMAELFNVLKNNGCQGVTKYIKENGKSVRLWSLPMYEEQQENKQSNGVTEAKKLPDWSQYDDEKEF